ncbi:MAG: type II toxin-antitoxin system RelE/ParE family toxin [Burkholderiales bacterium]
MPGMIRNFRHKGLERFFTKNEHSRIDAKQANRIRRVLDRLDVVARPEDMNLPGYGFHPLKSNRKGTYAISISGNWRITFRFAESDAIDVNLEDYR